METNSGGLESEDLMEMEEGEGSDLDDEEEELDDPISSPFQLALSDPASAATSTASSPPNNEDIPITPYTFSGKPLSIKRGRGRPRREGDKAVIRRTGAGTKVRRTKTAGYMRGIRRVKSLDRSDFDFSNIIPSPNEENLPMLDSEFGLFGISEREKMLMALEENPYPPEQWPGKVCALCNLGERSQLGQGDLMRLLCPDGFTPQRSASSTSHLQSVSDQVPDNESGDKSPRGPVTCRRQKSYNKCRMLSQNNEYIDELSIIGYTEEPDLQSIFEPLGIFFVHRRCATWSDSVVQHGLQNIGPVILQSTLRKCSYCNHFGASLACNADVCSKYYHFPCATAAGAFQDSKAVTNYCVQHLVQVPIVCESAVCYTCKMHGDIANLMFCSSCGEHYHGICVGLAQTPGIRAGWQCRKCRICQICRCIGDETKLMPCEQCDKVYHTTCQRPVVTSIPKYGWKCRCCRVCGDCGSRTPGAGSSSRWHNHYSVCDSCYQQRNKGYACPVCGRSYRAHAQREMVQCITCRRFVHGTCDPEADMLTYQVRKDSHPDYEYVCGVCKSDLLKKQQIQQQRNSFEEGDSFSGSQDYLFDDAYDFDYGQLSDDSVRFMGLGRGKPYSASKIAKKRLGLSIVGRPKGIGKGMAGKLGFAKRQRLVEFGRKRGPKSKMRGMFGVPGVGLQRPTSDGSRVDEEPGVENRLVLCSVKDKYVLNQDICVMCGALGTDQEGCLISCVQCGQCYHPYCVNVKVTRVILQKGWRCLDCTVCEGCGHRHDESRLILCDECDISFHIYCMDPPLEYVPHGNWKCKWCAICLMCGTTDPGFNCSWMNSYTECGPCASHSACASCSESYNEGDLIVQCVHCERWLHGSCDSIRSEKEAEKCVEDGYNCNLCRPRDVPPPHLQLTSSPKPSTPCKSPDLKSNTPYFMDGISLQEIGYIHIKSLTNTPSITRKKRKKFHPVQDKEAGIMATIESVVAGSNLLGSLEDGSKLELMDIKEDPQDLYKEGMLWTKEDGTPPDGFTLYTMESGVSVLRRKRQRNLQKLGIGGFIVRPRGIRGAQDNDDVDVLPGQLNESLSSQSMGQIMDGDKPRRKTNRRKPKSKGFENYPPHIQEAFFGKLSLETAKGLDSTSDSEEESIKSAKIGERTIQLSQEELRAVVAVTKHEKNLKQLSGNGISNTINKISNIAPIVPKEEDESDTEVLKDVLTLPGDLLDTDLVNTIMNEDDDELTKNTDALEALGDSNLPDDSNSTNALKETKDELTDILGSHFNIESIPNINSKDVEDIFKNVLTDESQESQESSSFSMSNTNAFSANSSQPSTSHPLSTAIRPTSLPTNNLNSPVGFPPQSPYHSEYSNSPQFSEPRSPWVTVSDTSDLEPASTPGVTTTYNQRSAEKMKADEGLGSGATISAVLYANMNHAEWKTDYPVWNDRYKQIIKKWRTLSTEQRAPYLQQARDNRSALRMKKQQQDQEKINQQQKTAREAEQERQWKQLQAIRQQQQQQHHVVLQEQRTQAIANVQRSLSDGAQPFITDQVGVLQVTSQQISPSSPSSTTPQFYPLTMKGNQISTSHPPQSKISQSPALPPLSSSSSNVNQTIIDTSNLQKLSHPPTLHNKTPLEPTVHMPTTPRLQFTTTRPNLQAYTSPVRQGDAPEMNPQLRDLLQRQQFKKLDEQLLPGKGQQRVWPPNDLSIQDSDQSNAATPAAIDVTFRQPLPPSTSRPKVATSGGLVLRQQGSVVGVRIPGSDPRMQSVDFRMKLLLQQQRGVVQSPLQQQFQQQGAQSRISSLTNARSPNVEQYEQILQKQTQIQNARQQAESPSPVPQSIIPIQRVPSIDQHVVPSNSNNDSSSTDQEIPDNVTAELEKLEQETGTMVELQGVSEILGGLGEDDDDILAEMGADFNILEYADPELDTLTGGEKTNILDSLDLVEPEPDKPDKREIKTSTVLHRVPVPPTSVILTRPNLILKSEPTMSIIPTSTTSIMSSRNLVRPSLPPPLAVSQHQTSSNAQASIAQLQLTPQQQMHQQMLLQVQHATSSGQPVSAGSKLLSDGVVNVVTSSNNVSLAFPANYAQRILNTHIQLQNQKLRLGTIGQGPRVALQSPTSSPQTIITELTSSRINLAPPPPPYPHPPPPYPGSSNANQEQPLLLEDLLEQEKREQEKQLQTQTNTTAESHASSALLSDHDFERLKADVLNSNIGLNNSGSVVNVPGQNVNASGTQIRSNFCSPTNNTNQWQQSPVRPSPVSTPQASIDPPQIPTFNMTLLPAPPLPPENIVSEQDRQAQVLYEQWLNNQNAILTQQLKYYETEVQKLRKIRKSLNSKQRQLRKSGNQLPEADAIELQRISAEQAVLQKHLESSRKQSRQHGMLIQEYRNKQQAKQQRPMSVQSPMMVGQQSQSPLNLPNSSPIQHPPQSPLMSPSPSPMMAQHNSPLQSPRPIVSHSPGLGVVASVIHSPSNTSSNMSPRIGTPHSQSEGSPGSVPSPSQVCLPPPMPRMTSPQHRRIVTSPITYSTELRPGMPQTRFVRPPITDQQHRPRLSISTANFLQRSGTPSPLNSPPPQQIQLTSLQQQQLLQRQLQQQALLIQQQNSPDGNQQSTEGTMHHSQRALQLIQQRQLIIRQQMLQQQVQQQQTQVLTSQQHQVMVQQQIAKQQQLAQIQAQVQNVRINPQSQIVNQPPSSPMPPRSPMINQGQQIMSPHSVHSQPTSPMINLNPNSPMARSPALHQSNSQPPNSPMIQHHQVTSPLPRSPIIGSIKSPLSMRRPPSTNSSPVMLDHPMNIENPSTPRPQYTPPSYTDNDHSNGGGGGGGNPNNPFNPLPMCGRFGFFKLGLRGGTPMWSLGRGAKRVPTNSDNKEDKIDSNHVSAVSSKMKRESHLNKVSILKKKASTSKSNLKSLTMGKASSLVSSDYNEFDDSSSTPPITPPPSGASTSRGLMHKNVAGKKLLEQSEIKDEIVLDNNMRCENVMDYDDDNDGAVVSTEVSLNSVAQQADSDDITVIETFSQNDLTDTISSPLEPGQIGEDYLLFPGNMVVDISNTVHYSDKEEDEEEEEYGEQIVNVAIQSPTPSEEELIIQGKTKQVTSDGLTLNIVHGLSSNQLLAVTDTPDSPEQEELNVDPSPEHYSSQNTDEEILSHADEPEVVLIGRKDLDKTSNVDYEQLIDVTNEKTMKRDTTSNNRLTEIHKYTTKSTTANFQSVNLPITSVSQTITLNTKTTTINLPTQKLSSASSSISNSANSSKTNILGTNVITRTAKFTNPNSPTLTSIILPIKTTTSPAITIVGSSSSRFTIPVISASAISKLTNVKVIDKPSSSLSLAAHDACLPKKIFDDESSVSPDSSTCEDEKFKLDFGDEKFKTADEKQCVNIEGESSENNGDNLIKNDPDCLTRGVREHSLSSVNEIVAKKLDSAVQISNTSIKDHLQRLNNPAVISNAPELKMTAQVVQEKGNANVQMTCSNVETIQASYATTRDSIDCSNDSDNDSKSVVISIPSPTPSQEQMLDNITLQALENRRREGKRITSEFDTFEDVLDMIENITGETPTLLEANIKDKIKCDDISKITKQESNENIESASQVDNSKMSDDRKIKSPTELQIPVTVSTSGKSTIMPQLSPLSQPTDLTTNMANVSQQLRTLLSSLNTTTVTTSPNVATIVKSDIHNKDKVTGTSSSRIIQTSSILSPLISNANVIFSSAKQKPVVAFTVPSVGIVSKNILVSSSVGSAFAPITTTLSSGASNTNTVTKVLTTSTSNAVQSIPDHPKLTLVTSVPSSLIQTCNLVTSVSQKPTPVPVGITTTSDAQSMKKSLNLNAMLQSHPAASVAQIAPGTLTTATILGSSITIAKSSFSPSMVHAQPVVVSPVVTNSSTTSPFISFNASGISKPIVATTNLLHSQLTKVNVLRSKSNEDQQQLTMDLIKKEEIKQEPSESLDLDISPPILQKSEFSGCKYSAIQCTSRVEDSQNVLLKQLLQNTACATTSQPLSTSTTSGTISNAPSLPLVPNLEAQLARPVPPTPTSLLPPLLQNDNVPVPSKSTVVTRETSFVSKHTAQPVAIQQLHIDVKKCLPPSRTPSRDELLSPPTPRSTCSQDSFIPTPPLYIKKEYQSMSSLPSPLLTPHEVKKEFVDETSQHSEISDHSRPDIHIKEEMDLLDSSEKTTLEQKEELKKMKRRAYQQKRRQIQTMNKEMAGQPKKRARKSSKIDEDYDTYMEGVLAQLRTLPPMVVQEAQLHRNFGIASIFGGGDFSRMGVRNDLKCGELSGAYGNAAVTGCSDFYNTKPYGNLDPLPPKPPISTQRGFYETEFPPLRFESEDDRKFELFCRDADTPDSVVSDSSGDECLQNDSFSKFLGLKLIDDCDDDDHAGANESDSKENGYGKRPMSPIVPIVVPIPIRLKPLDPYLKDYSENDKENIYKDYSSKSKLTPGQAGSLKDSGNVTVTLTLTSSAAEDIMGVLRDLANLLHIPPPTSYQIVERTGTPPSQKLGLYRTKGKDGKEGTPIDIQSILNGAAKFCKHCDVVILKNIIRKKVAELPNLSKWTEIVGDSDEIYFCSGACYMQFSIIHRIPPMPENKAATTIDYISQKETQKKSVLDHTGDNSLNRLSALGRILNKQSTISDFMEVDRIKTESIYSTQHEELDFKQKHFDNFDNMASPKIWRDVRYKHWITGCLQSNSKYKKPTDKETMELLYRLGITVLPAKLPEDTRRCMFCQNVGDGVADGPGRLLNFDVDKWIHLNCGLWSDLVYETVNGALMNLENAIQISLVTVCGYCNKYGATIRCFKTRCSNIYHLPCAIKERCVFYKNKSVFCASHALKNDKDNEITTLSVSRRVYVNRDENRQVAAVMHHASDTSNLLRVGSLIFLNVGQLLPHQLQNFHTANYIYPIGYKIWRFYWSMRRVNKRCRYLCSIHEISGRPEFRIVVQDPPEEDVEFRDASPKAVWNPILEQIALLRKENHCLQVFPKYISGEDLFGLTEPAVVRVLESLPGIETLVDYKFKYGRNPLLELPLAVNPSGAARTEPKSRNQFNWKRPHTQRTGSSVRPVYVSTATGIGEAVCPYSKQFVHSKSSQYKKMKQEWKNNIYLARSKIQGLGLYAARDLEKHTMVIEYIGEIIRTELAETREKQYEARNRGIYMFRLDEERVIDATLSGGLARYINHSCNPNCVAEIVEVDRDLRIIIFAKRRIQRGEELAYDYKFDIEDDQHKISCMCGAPNCRKWMN